MDKFSGLFCKSFVQDFVHLSHLIDSFEICNVDGLELVISIPERDKEVFFNSFGRHRQNVVMVADESYAPPDTFLMRGWHAQQVCKLESWRVVRAPYYLVVDSDCYFVRDFRENEIAPLQRKYICCGSLLRTVYKEDNKDLLRYLDGGLHSGEFSVPSHDKDSPCSLENFRHLKDADLDNPGALERSDIPFRIFGGKKWIYFQPGQIFSREILHKLAEFATANNLSIADLIRISPWEYNWYGEFSRGLYYSDTEFRISPIFHFQSDHDILKAVSNGVTEQLIAKDFFCVQMAARHISLARFPA